jgi:MFS family permease
VACGPYQCHHLLDRWSHVSTKYTRKQAELTCDSGAFIVDPLNKYLGRRGEIFLTAMCLTATPIGSGFAKSWQGLFAARFIMGIGIGAKNATVPIYSAEMAPARIRGALVMFWQLWVVIGEPSPTSSPLGPLLIGSQVSSAVSWPTSLSRTFPASRGASSSVRPSSRPSS